MKFKSENERYEHHRLHVQYHRILETAARTLVLYTAVSLRLEDPTRLSRTLSGGTPSNEDLYVQAARESESPVGITCYIAPQYRLTKVVSTKGVARLAVAGT